MKTTALIPSPPRGRKTRDLPLPFQPVILAGQLRASSIAVYSRDALAYCDWAKSRRKDPLKPATLGDWREYLAIQTQLSPHTINRMLAAVKRLMKEAAARDKLKPASAKAFQEQQGVKVSAYRERLKPHARIRIAPTEMRQIVNQPDAATLKGLRDAALLHTLASSGVRVSEAASLTIGQVEWRTVMIDEQEYTGPIITVQGKNDVLPRETVLSEEAYAAILDWRAACPVQTPYLFPAMSGRGQRWQTHPMSPQAVWQIAHDYAETAELKHIKPHDFRRFVGTQLSRQDLRKAQKVLGHKRIETLVQHYVLDQVEPGLTNHLY